MSHKCAPTLPGDLRSSTSRRGSREIGPACFKMATVRIIGPDRWAKIHTWNYKKKLLREKIDASLESPRRIFCYIYARYVNLYVIMKPLQLARIEQTRTNCIRYRNINIIY